MQTDELRRELRVIADDMEPFEADVRPVRRAVARRRAAIVSTLVAVLALGVAGAVTLTRSSNDQLSVETSPRSVELSELAHVDVVIVPPAFSDDGDRVQNVLDSLESVDRYAVFRFGGTNSLVTSCPNAAAYAVQGTTDVLDVASELRAALGQTYLIVDRTQPEFDPDRFFRDEKWLADTDLEIFMVNPGSEADVASLRAALAADARVASVTYLDHVDAYEVFKDIFEDQPDLIQSTAPEDLPVSFRLKLHNRADTDAVTRKYANAAGVDEIISTAGSQCDEP